VYKECPEKKTLCFPEKNLCAPLLSTLAFLVGRNPPILEQWASVFVSWTPGEFPVPAFSFCIQKTKKTGRSRKKNLGFFSGHLTNEGDLQGFFFWNTLY